MILANRLWRMVAVCAILGASLLVAQSARAADGAGATDAITHSTGATADGGTWVADVPSNWNGTLILYSHGYGITTALDAPDPRTGADLLSMGYALAGSSYDNSSSLWSVASGVHDQFETLGIVERTLLPHRPNMVLAMGTSMGGLISALEDQHADGRIDGALTTCGIVAGGVDLDNYQLDGEFAMNQLLDPSHTIQLVGYGADAAAANTAAGQLQALGQSAQQSGATGRARLALAMAFLNVTDWSPTGSMPAPRDYVAQEQGQYDTEFGFTAFPIIPFTVVGRGQTEIAIGGNSSWDVGVDWAGELRRSPYYREVRALYRAAHLNLRADLADLARHADTTADPGALAVAERTTVPNGRLQVPELDLHTSADNLVPVQMETAYARKVARAGDSRLLRQAYVIRQVHCNFVPSELIAGVLALQRRVQAGHWGGVAAPASLEAAANGLGFGDSPNFGAFRPGNLIGTNGADRLHRHHRFSDRPWWGHGHGHRRAHRGRVDRGHR